MANNPENNNILEYLKLLLPRGDQSAAAFNNAIRNFFLYSLIFFVFSQFQTTELSMFGAKVNIPQEWISAVAPLALAFCYIRVVTLYELQENYKIEIEKTSKDFFGKSKRAEIKSARISKTIFWFVNPPLMDSKRGVLYLLIYIFINFSAILTVFLIPIIIISYFIWIIWHSNLIPPPILIAVTTLSGLYSLLGLILSIQQLVAEPSLRGKD
jgi:hypothetical protein